MSYEIITAVKEVTTKDGLRFAIKGDSNNVSPKRYHWYKKNEELILLSFKQMIIDIQNGNLQPVRSCSIWYLMEQMLWKEYGEENLYKKLEEEPSLEHKIFNDYLIFKSKQKSKRRGYIKILEIGYFIKKVRRGYKYKSGNFINKSTLPLHSEIEFLKFKTEIDEQIIFEEKTEEVTV